MRIDIGLVSDPDVIWRKIMEVYGMELTIHDETWPYIDEFFRNVPEALRKVPTFQEALKQSEKRGEERGEERGILQAQRRTLIRLLHHKFEELPDEIVQLIETTNNLEQLDEWLDQVLDADALAEMKFTPEEDSSNTETDGQ